MKIYRTDQRGQRALQQLIDEDHVFWIGDEETLDLECAKLAEINSVMKDLARDGTVTIQAKYRDLNPTQYEEFLQELDGVVMMEADAMEIEIWSE